MYGKIFASLYQGTLRGRAHEILVFTNMIACADQTGIVDKHPKAIAEEIGLDIEATRQAIESLEAPDPESRSLDHGGARIVKAFDGRAWGWQIVNYMKYRAIRSEEDRREQNRLAQERYRNKSKPASANVSQGKPASAERQHDKPKEKEKEKEKNTDASCSAAARPARPTQPQATAKTWMAWRLEVGRSRVYIDMNGNAEAGWSELFKRSGWDEFTKAWTYCTSRATKPDGKIFLANMLEVLQ
jgi:hypothetical protein